MYKAPGAGGVAGAGAGALAYTGVNVSGLIVFGALLLVAGVVALVAARRRRRRITAGQIDE